MLPWLVSHPARANGNLTHGLPVPATRLDFKQTAACRALAPFTSSPTKEHHPTHGLQQAAQDLARLWDHPTHSPSALQNSSDLSQWPPGMRESSGAFAIHPGPEGNAGEESTRSARVRVASGPEYWQCQQRQPRPARLSRWSSGLALRFHLEAAVLPPALASKRWGRGQAAWSL